MTHHRHSSTVTTPKSPTTTGPTPLSHTTTKHPSHTFKPTVQFTLEKIYFKLP
ncbi:hypothetical protein Hanom_Chr11g00979641 [Helianthus anomalus]